MAATPMNGWGERNSQQFLRFAFANESVERLCGVGDRIKAALGV